MTPAVQAPVAADGHPALRWGLTRYWFPMAWHREQQAFYHNLHRFVTLPAGRRSGKTELGKRRLVRAALLGTAFDDARFCAAAPTWQQAKRIYWNDLKKLIPPRWIRDKSESELRLQLITGAEIWVTGLDKPDRVEGSPWDGFLVTEFASIKPRAWEENIYPALADRSGWAVLEGVPEGRNHFWDLHRKAQAQMREQGPASPWGAYHWRSETVLPLYGKAEEIAHARAHMDPLTYEQEFGASFVTFQGRAYYTYGETTHAVPVRYLYRPRLPLIFCLDFNVEPGVAVVAQEVSLPHGLPGTAIIGEVHIPRDSNTPRVCKALAATWKDHAGPVLCYGDATGGARKTSQTEGTDWELVRAHLRPTFGDRLHFRVPPANPSERARVNAVNARLRSSTGMVRLMVDPKAAPETCRDFEGVSVLSDGSLDKGKDPSLSHLSDAAGYYIAAAFPVRDLGRQAATTDDPRR